MRVNGTLYYVLGDQLGSASVVMDANGTVVGETRYYPFGEIRSQTGSMYTDRLFTGQQQMASLGLYNYGARFYSPTLGRFIQPDTIIPSVDDPQSLNRYSYVGNNPINFIDPSGHMRTDGGSGKAAPIVNKVVTNVSIGKTTSITTPKATTTPSTPPTAKPTATPTSTPTPVITLAPTKEQAMPQVLIDPYLYGTSTPATVLRPGATSTTTQTPTQQSPIRNQPQKQVIIDWKKVDYFDLGIDALGIAGDIVLVFAEPAGGFIDAAVTVVELVGAGKAIYDATQQDYSGVSGLSVDSLLYVLEKNPRLELKTTRWIPLIGSIASGISIYQNLDPKMIEKP